MVLAVICCTALVTGLLHKILHSIVDRQVDNMTKVWARQRASQSCISEKTCRVSRMILLKSSCFLQKSMWVAQHTSSNRVWKISDSIKKWNIVPDYINSASDLMITIFETKLLRNTREMSGKSISANRFKNGSWISQLKCTLNVFHWIFAEFDSTM